MSVICSPEVNSAHPPRMLSRMELCDRRAGGTLFNDSYDPQVHVE